MKTFKQWCEETTDESLFEMSNLWPEDTGLAQVIWVSTENANHGPRIKVFEGVRAAGNSVSITIEDNPRVIGNASFLKSRDIDKIFEFIKKNKENLLAYWNYQISTKVFTNNVLKV